MAEQPVSVTLAITGASGTVYAERLLQCLLAQGVAVHLLVSDAAREVARLETGAVWPEDAALAAWLAERLQQPVDKLRVWGSREWTAPVASGSADTGPMVVCPCSGGALSAIAVGASNNLIERAADVCLKEGRLLVLVPRETPVSAIHLENQLKLAKLGVTILPASPGFYQRPQSVNDLVDFIVARILSRIGLPQTLLAPWGNDVPNNRA